MIGEELSPLMIPWRPSIDGLVQLRGEGLEVRLLGGGFLFGPRFGAREPLVERG